MRRHQKMRTAYNYGSVTSHLGIYRQHSVVHILVSSVLEKYDQVFSQS